MIFEEEETRLINLSKEAPKQVTFDLNPRLEVPAFSLSLVSLATETHFCSELRGILKIPGTSIDYLSVKDTLWSAQSLQPSLRYIKDTRLFSSPFGFNLDKTTLWRLNQELRIQWSERKEIKQGRALLQEGTDLFFTSDAGHFALSGLYSGKKSKKTTSTTIWQIEKAGHGRIVARSAYLVTLFDTRTQICLKHGLQFQSSLLDLCGGSEPLVLTEAGGVHRIANTGTEKMFELKGRRIKKMKLWNENEFLLSAYKRFDFLDKRTGKVSITQHTQRDSQEGQGKGFTALDRNGQLFCFGENNKLVFCDRRNLSHAVIQVGDIPGNLSDLWVHERPNKENMLCGYNARGEIFLLEYSAKKSIDTLRTPFFPLSGSATQFCGSFTNDTVALIGVSLNETSQGVKMIQYTRHGRLMEIDINEDSKQTEEQRIETEYQIYKEHACRYSLLYKQRKFKKKFNIRPRLLAQQNNQVETEKQFLSLDKELRTVEEREDIKQMLSVWRAEEILLPRAPEKMLERTPEQNKEDSLESD